MVIRVSDAFASTPLLQLANTTYVFVQLDNPECYVHLSELPSTQVQPAQQHRNPADIANNVSFESHRSGRQL